MEVARYGRMELGRCVSKDYGHIGMYPPRVHSMKFECLESSIVSHDQIINVIHLSYKIVISYRLLC